MNTHRISALICCAVLALAGCSTPPSGSVPPSAEEQVVLSPQVVLMQSSLRFGSYLVVKKNPEVRPVLVTVAHLMGSLANDGRVAPLEISAAVNSLLAEESDDVRMGVGLALDSVLALYGGFVSENTLTNGQLKVVLGVLSEGILAGVQPGTTSLTLPEA